MTVSPELPAINVAEREKAARSLLEPRELDALIVTSPTNIRWLTGFAGSSATVVLTTSGVTLLTDSRYAERAPVELAAAASTAAVVVARATLGDEVAKIVGAGTVVGLEAEHVSWSQQRLIESSWLPEAELVPTSHLVDELRASKDSAEIARIKAAAHIVDQALASTVDELKNEPTERSFARLLEDSIRSGGADGLGFDTIVASGPNAAIPHHAPGDRVITAGDLVIVDVGGMVDGYRSDMTRTFCVGGFTPEQRRHYETVEAAQQAGVDAMVDGAETVLVDDAARAVIEAAGWGDQFSHGTGHGVGLDIHELPRVAKRTAQQSDVYQLGTVATVEPGIYLPGVGGVRVEDTCVVTAAGAERLTQFPKSPELT